MQVGLIMPPWVVVRLRPEGWLHLQKENELDTGKRGAVPNNSGEPVDHSGPGLGAGPTTPTTAGRKPEACPSAFAVGVGFGVDLGISQNKSGRGSGGGAPSGANEESAVLRSAATQPELSSLDIVQINRYSNAAKELPRRGSKRHCGVRTLRGLVEGHEKVIRLDCKTWTCAHCGPRKAWRYKQAISAVAEQ